jgi:hypothetical protein
MTKPPKHAMRASAAAALAVMRRASKRPLSASPSRFASSINMGSDTRGI